MHHFWFSCHARLAVVLAIVVLLMGTPATMAASSSSTTTLRVGCQVGQAPFNDVGHGNSSCHGLFYDVFARVCARANISFNITVLNTDQVDQYIMPNASLGGATTLDALIAFHTITPERMEYTDFSIVMYETGYRIALNPSFHQPAGSITSSVIRESVLYIMSVMGTVIALFGIVVAIIESMTPGSEVASKPPWQRLLWGYEQAFETVATGGMSVDANNQATRSLRTVIAFIGFFLANIFGALITSNLTASALGASTPTVLDVRNTKLAVASPTLLSHLSGLQVGAQVTDVGNIENFADRWYNGLEPTYDGWAGPADVVNYIHRNSNPQGHEVSDVFFISGSPDLKAFPFARTVDSALRVDFDLHLQHMREDGEMAAIFSNVTAAAGPTADDYPVPLEGAKAVGIACGIVYGLSLVVVGVVWLLKRDEGKEATPHEEKESREAAIADDPKAFTLLWEGKRLIFPAKLRGVVDGLVASSDRIGDAFKATNNVNGTAQGKEEPSTIFKGDDVVPTAAPAATDNEDEDQPAVDGANPLLVTSVSDASPPGRRLGDPAEKQDSAEEESDGAEPIVIPDQQA